MATTLFIQCEKQGYGQLVGLSSIGAFMPSPSAPAYHASKAFVSQYMKSVQKKIIAF
ncbi:SDR family NAD(P)-dependent oxidoreductase [Shouchella patagoniensis]|uniref:SDR family NAD(P)-dependent oxidoreductase n=1 Tax=Shouchella patagoniensis TaxID=228576 RepID=UPI0009958AFD|nr:SDR family NAD(P)-dependent oxidoreductase [Shouchella patagoniensis]